jgi:adenylate cyclase
MASTPGVGTTFTVRLPSDIGTMTPAVAQAVGSVAAPDSTLVGIGQAVLVIDDDESVRDLMQRYLQQEGLAVVTAANGLQGLQLAKEVQPVAITLDVMMPEMDGWSVLEALKADPLLSEIPVILVTMVDDKSKGYALGAVDYVTKPVDRESLAGLFARIQSMPGSGPVLVVEDDEGARELLRRELEREGLEVVEAENGRIGLERVAEITPRLILLDLIMPEMDGFEFVENLRQHPARVSIPIVVITGKNLLAEDRERLNGHVRMVLQKGATKRDEMLSQIVELVHASAKWPAHTGGSG